MSSETLRKDNVPYQYTVVFDDKFKEMEKAKKLDSNKPEIELIDPKFLEGLAKVLTFGKEKYGRNNWRNGFNLSRIISAAYRHLGEVNGGKDVDEESNLPTVYHLAACVMFLAWQLENKPELDDRWKQ